MRRRRRLMLAAILAGALFLGRKALFEISKARCFSLVGEAICRVPTGQPLVALTFDDGPTRRGVDAVLPVLAKHHARGTFFLIGARAEPALVKRIVAGGHEVGNHSYSHEALVFRTADRYDRELSLADAALMAAGAPRPVLFRPPHGKKLIGLPWAVERSGKRMIMWELGDRPGRDPRGFARRIVEGVRPGSIVLIHPMDEGNTVERAALPLILDGLEKRGFEMVTVSELLAAADQ